jgi:hypothetical protein
MALRWIRSSSTRLAGVIGLEVQAHRVAQVSAGELASFCKVQTYRLAVMKPQQRRKQVFGLFWLDDARQLAFPGFIASSVTLEKVRQWF